MIATTWDWILLLLGFTDFFIGFNFCNATCVVYLCQLNLVAYAKEKEGSSIIERLFFTRFKKQLPKFLFFRNAITLISYPVRLVVFVILVSIKEYVPAFQIISYTLWISLAIDFAWIILNSLFCFTEGFGPDYRRWIRRRGKKWDD